MNPTKRLKRISKIFGAALAITLAIAPGVTQTSAAQALKSAPTFSGSFTTAGKEYNYTIAGRAPESGGTTTIPAILVPLTLRFEGRVNTKVIAAAPVVAKVIASPIFQKFPFATGDTQYGDAVQRAQFYHAAKGKDWHTLLGLPRVTHPLEIQIPPADGYLLTSRRTGHSLAVVDLEFAKKKLFEALPSLHLSPGTLVIALARNADFYPMNDATVCCAWGAHGANSEAGSNTAQAYILGTYLDPGVVPGYSDVQTLTAQVAQWMNDPLSGYRTNAFPPWRNPGQPLGCGGRGVGTFYRSAEPTDHPALKASTAVTLNGVVYHVANAALLPWFAQSGQPESFRGAYSFPDTTALSGPAQPCTPFRFSQQVVPKAAPLVRIHGPNGHQLIGYWAGYSRVRTIPLRDVSPQWDVVIVAFASPAKDSTSLLQFHVPAGYTKDQFKADIEDLQNKGKEVLISLGGGGQVVTLNTADETRQFVDSVAAVVSEYGFNGIDLDLETPSLILAPGDTDFRHPTTPAVVNLIDAMQQLRRRFGPKFMLAEVPEGPQVPAGLVAYGGQFGSFLPVIYATRNFLSFVDVQNYNTPPLEGLDGDYYMPNTADYYVAMTEMMLRGFNVGGEAKSFFPPLPPDKVAIGFLVGRSPLPAIEQSLRCLIQGKRFAEQEYELRRPAGYPDFDGAMFWNIQADRQESYRMSNAIGPLLHRLPPVTPSR